jgi:hypothetical protein
MPTGTCRIWASGARWLCSDPMPIFWCGRASHRLCWPGDFSSRYYAQDSRIALRLQVGRGRAASFGAELYTPWEG